VEIEFLNIVFRRKNGTCSDQKQKRTVQSWAVPVFTPHRFSRIRGIYYNHLSSTNEQEASLLKNMIRETVQTEISTPGSECLITF